MLLDSILRYSHKSTESLCFKSVDISLRYFEYGGSMSETESSMPSGEFFYTSLPNRQSGQIKPQTLTHQNKNEFVKPKIRLGKHAIQDISEHTLSSHGNPRNTDKQEHFTKNLKLVRYQVRLIGGYAREDEVEDLYQEGLLALWEILDQSESQNWPNQNFKISAKRIINTRLQHLRRQQRKNHRGFSAIDTLPDEDNINAALNSICIQKALATLHPDERYAIATDFGINITMPDNNLSPRTKRRKKKSGLVRLSKNKNVQSLMPHRFAS